MAVTLSKRSVLDEFYAKRHRIIEEGSLYLTYIYSYLGKRPKRIYTFDELLESFKTLRVIHGKNEIQLKGIGKYTERPETPLKTMK